MTRIMMRLYAGAAAGAALLGGVALVSAQQMPDKGGAPPTREPSVRDKAPDSKSLREPPGAQQPPGSDLPKGGAERPDKDRPKGAERPDATRPGTAQPDLDKTALGRPRLSDQQRNDVGVKLRETKVERTRGQVSVNIGSRIPRSVRLHPLPSAIIVSAPAYGGHSYLVQDDGTIVIVDTSSYVVVDVIPASTRAAGLSLSPEQMRFIYSTVPKNQIADVRARLALGAEVPAHVELLPFPTEVRMLVPQIVGYRYVVAGRDVVIVDPRDRDIALVITE